jgi:predicted transcriptional regulator
MGLSDWLHEQGITPVDFAARIGCSHTTVYRLMHGTRRPGWGLVARIEKETGGAVTANDFSPASARRPDAA